MSGFEMKPVDEAQFHAFLQGKDELSELLRALPQPRPTAEFDAAILQMVSKDLIEPDAVPEAGAANDAQFSAKNSVNNPSFLSGFWQRWRMPLALAASAAFAVPLYFIQFSQPKHESAEIAAAKTVEIPHASASGKPLTEIAMADTAVTQPQAAASAISKPSEEEKPPAKARAENQGDEKKAKKAAIVAKNDTAEATEKAQPAQSEPKELLADASQAMRSGAQAHDRAAQVAADARMQESARMAQESRQIADAKRQAETLARAEVNNLNRRKEMSGAEHEVLAKPAPAAAPVAAAPPAPGASSTDMPEKADKAEAVAGKKSASNQARAKSWLMLVDELLKAGMKQEALEEWQKFRKAYPYEPVPERLQLQMKILQNAQQKSPQNSTNP